MTEIQQKFLEKTSEIIQEVSENFMYKNKLTVDDLEDRHSIELMVFEVGDSAMIGLLKYSDIFFASVFVDEKDEVIVSTYYGEGNGESTDIQN